ncbi:hypothetical protein PHMEG_00017119 [Phytophthora megakarya]|uniref:Uncharacterized protein n=1 Tax=Phytophthora megakarya TaxID=4795 RepID=A0A225VXD1_9STRA|nr:hypothetical protein PHMEG_00017119 [Phytophthora megakarya]
MSYYESYSSERADQDEDDDVLFDEDAVETDEAFIEALQLNKNKLDKRAIKEQEAALREMQ